MSAVRQCRGSEHCAGSGGLGAGAGGHQVLEWVWLHQTPQLYGLRAALECNTGGAVGRLP